SVRDMSMTLLLYHIVGQPSEDKATLVVELPARLHPVLEHDRQKLEFHRKSESSGESTQFRPRLLRDLASCQHVAACCPTILYSEGRDRGCFLRMPAPAAPRVDRCS